MKNYLIYLTLFISLAGCAKSGIGKDTVAPVVTINTPTNNQSFADGQTVTISGSITDDKFVAEIHILVTNNTTGMTYIHSHVYPSSGAANFSQDFTVNTGINYKIEIIGVDRSLNQTSSSVVITCY